MLQYAGDENNIPRKTEWDPNNKIVMPIRKEKYSAEKREFCKCCSNIKFF